MKVPKSFKLFNTTFKVVFDDKYCNAKESYGETSYSKSSITLSNTENGIELSEDRILDTFYHEKVHAILDSMNENELSCNEKFVDVFGKLLRQSIETAEF